MANQSQTPQPVRRRKTAPVGERCGKPVDPDFPCDLDPGHVGDCEPKQ